MDRNTFERVEQLMLDGVKPFGTCKMFGLCGHLGKSFYDNQMSSVEVERGREVICKKYSQVCEYVRQKEALVQCQD